MPEVCPVKKQWRTFCHFWKDDHSECEGKHIDNYKINYEELVKEGYINGGD